MTKEMMQRVNGGLSSSWDGLNTHLIAKIFEVERDGAPKAGGVVVMAPFGDDVQLDIDLNWQSPFENAGVDSAAPALSAMLQSGALANVLERAGQSSGINTSGVASTAASAIGRASMTKLNSVQIFTGAPPVKIQGELVLRAWKNPQSEVEAILDQLAAWALPQYLAPEGGLVESAMGVVAGQKELLEGAFPSLAPALVGLTYKGRTYSPLVIERLGVPLGSPIDSHGRFVTMKISISLATVSAIDGSDWLATKSAN
ncbi:MAG: hypothetical protein ACRCWB_11530 [Enterovibrio sp.]